MTLDSLDFSLKRRNVFMYFGRFWKLEGFRVFCFRTGLRLSEALEREAQPEPLQSGVRGTGAAATALGARNAAEAEEDAHRKAGRKLKKRRALGVFEDSSSTRCALRPSDAQETKKSGGSGVARRCVSQPPASSQRAAAAPSCRSPPLPRQRGGSEQSDAGRARVSVFSRQSRIKLKHL